MVVILDENLSWKAHISHIACKISKAIGIIFRSSSCLFKRALRLLYFTLVYPYLQYCIAVWGSMYSTNVHRLTILQKRVIRIIDKQTFRAHTNPIFKKLSILKFDDIYLFNLGKFVYQYKSKSLLNCFECPLLLVNEIHSYNTRNSKLFYIPKCKTNIRQFSISYQGPTLFNTLSPDICNSSSLSIFQSKLKTFQWRIQGTAEEITVEMLG